MATKPTLHPGESGPLVTELQELLNAAGFSVPITGVFDAATTAAVKAYQAAKGLDVDGVVGKQTWGSLLGSGSSGPAIGSPSDVDLSGAPNEAGYLRLYRISKLEENTTNEFRWGLLQVAARLATDPNYLAAVMRVETGGTFSPSVKNPMGGATGLIQFMPSTATKLGTSTDELAQMTAVEQLAYVEKYFKSFAGKMKSPTDVYMATFMPAFVGKPPSFVLGRDGDDSKIPGAGGLTYAQVFKYNKGFDHNKDGEITVGEVGSTVENLLAKARLLEPIEVIPPQAEGETPSAFDTGFDVAQKAKAPAVILGIAALALAVWRYGWPWGWRLP